MKSINNRYLEKTGGTQTHSRSFHKSWTCRRITRPKILLYFECVFVAVGTYFSQSMPSKIGDFLLSRCLVMIKYNISTQNNNDM
jgi:hypothetical protein